MSNSEMHHNYPKSIVLFDQQYNMSAPADHHELKISVD